MKCRRCRAAAVIDLPRHNAAFCTECFRRHCREQVRRALDEHRMVREGERVLVAVSGGKDSLACWDLLRALGIPADGMVIGLGIGDYSRDSTRYARDFAEARGWPLQVVDVRERFGFDVPTAAAATRRAPCGACGLTKRHLFNQVAIEGGYDVLATGHNLDDEAAVLLGNVLHWEEEYLARQRPTLPGRDGFVRKVKPLVRLSERETAAYCVVSGIDYQVEECPMAAGNRHLAYKEALNAVEARSPGTKAAFVAGFWSRAHRRFAEARPEPTLGACTGCGAPTPGTVCAFCRLQARAAG